MEIDAALLKSKGFFQQAEKNLFSLRLSTSGGTIDAPYLKKVIEIAEKYGTGQVHLTTRQQVEIPGVPAKNIEAVQNLLADAHIKTFVGGARARTVTACLGAGICKFGKIKTAELAQIIHQNFVGRELPAKLKIAITGCRNNCARVEGNDIGIRGAAEGYILYFGGCFGQELRIGKTIIPALHNQEDVLKVIEAAVSFFANNGIKGERFGKFLDRAGLEVFKKAIEAVS